MIKALRERIGDDADYFWELAALPHQRPPEGDWTTWLIMGGRGAGKTRAGAEWIRAQVGAVAVDRVAGARDRFALALVAETYADAREVMIEGPSGIRAVTPQSARPRYEASRRRLVWPSGAIAHCFSAEEPDGLRGYQFHGAWSDELAKWRYPEETWSNLQLALRLGARPRQVATTTPRPMALLKRLLKARTTRTTRASSYANRDNLSAAFFAEIADIYEGTALGRQELHGELIEEVAGALWTLAALERARVQGHPPLSRIVVAVDPPATSGPRADACGIVVAGRCGEGLAGRAYVLADRSVQGLSPAGWAQRAASAFDEFAADRVVVETNQGGEMATAVLRQAAPHLPIRGVAATRGKRLRAEPVAALYERGRVFHAARMDALEAEMTSFTGAPGAPSPDRLDALVWALSDLMLTRPARPALRRLD